MDVASAEGADAFQFYEDAPLMLVFEDNTFDAFERTIEDADTVAFVESRVVGKGGDDVFPTGLDDDAETLHLPVGDDEVGVATESVCLEMVIVWSKAGDIHVEYLGVFIQSSANKDEGLVEGSLNDDLLGIILIGIIEVIMFHHRQEGDDVISIERNERVIDSLGTPTRCAYGVPRWSIYYR